MRLDRSWIRFPEIKETSEIGSGGSAQVLTVSEVLPFVLCIEASVSTEDVWLFRASAVLDGACPPRAKIGDEQDGNLEGQAQGILRGG